MIPWYVMVFTYFAGVMSALGILVTLLVIAAFIKRGKERKEVQDKIAKIAEDRDKREQERKSYLRPVD